ncbi:30S ribosomal protein S9 [Candidatus Woesearchaeota archaeon]|nr:30S ribosomal protein S9 [Candidatus Woesearchaeota archaeon]
MKNTIHTDGKRKQAVARATLRTGTGKVLINGKLLHSLTDHLTKLRILEPLVLCGELATKVNIDVNVHGGGVNGQADASRLAIARALVQYDGKLKKIFNDYDRLLLVADVRKNEVSKPNDSKPRAKRQKSYR